MTTSPYVLLSNSYASDGNGANLKNLSLAGNNFSGPITDSISGLESIQSLDFSRNSFSGDMAASLTKLTNLVLKVKFQKALSSFKT